MAWRSKSEDCQRMLFVAKALRYARTPFARLAALTASARAGFAPIVEREDLAFIELKVELALDARCIRIGRRKYPGAR